LMRRSESFGNGGRASRRSLRDPIACLRQNGD
jgi:hypothetical protein